MSARRTQTFLVLQAIYNSSFQDRFVHSYRYLPPVFGMKRFLWIVIGVLGISQTGAAQSWFLQLSSNVELRSLKLSNKAERSETGLAGANIALYQGDKLVKTVKSNAEGDFTIDVPPNGEFILVVSYGDCNAKKFSVNTTGVPSEIGNDNFKPKFGIGGFLMAKPLPGINYSILSQPLVKVKWIADRRKFDHDEGYTDQILNGLGKVAETENALISKFVEAAKAGDEALKKNDCPLAKQNYEKALALIPGEAYPKEQLLKVGKCLGQEEEARKKAEEASAAKAGAQKEQAEKAAAEKLAREKAQQEKAEAERQAREKAAAEKVAAEKLAAEKQAADKARKEQADREKAEADRLAREKASAEKASSEKAQKEQAEADRLAKEEARKNKEESERVAREKAAREKEEAARLAKEKAEKEKTEKKTAPASTEKQTVPQTTAPVVTPAPQQEISPGPARSTEKKSSGRNKKQKTKHTIYRKL
jgi:hypothetical protein